jgi:predicted nucleotidyltransferase
VTAERQDSPEVPASAHDAARLLARDPRVLLVYLFGSAAAPDRAPRDLDLAVLTEPALSLEELVRLRADLVLAVREPIDLISLNGSPIVLAHEVVDGGTCLFARSPEIETDFVCSTRSRYWDFAHFREEQWRLVGERLAARSRGS